MHRFDSVAVNPAACGPEATARARATTV